MKLQLELREELWDISSFNSMMHDASTKHLGTVELCFTESHLESNEPGVTEVKRPKCDSELKLLHLQEHLELRATLSF